MKLINKSIYQRIQQGTLLALSPCLFVGCALIPRDKLPEPLVPEVASLEKNIAQENFVIQKDWWQGFNDANLNTLMDKALKGSPSLTSADARMQAAQALYEANRGVLIPQIGIGAQVTRQQFSRNYIYVPSVMKPIDNYGLVAANLQWSLDLWGKQKKLMQSAGLKLDSAKASYEAARLGLSATIAGVYVDYDHASKGLELAKEEAGIRQKLLEIAELRKKSGIVDENMLNQRKIEADMSSVRMGQAELAVKQLQHQLAVLAGEGPSWGERLPRPQLNLDVIGKNFPQKIPADLLARRPDLQALLKHVEASRLEVGAAKLEYLPNIDLNANIGFQAYGLDRLFQAPSQIFGIGPVLSLPIFDGGRIDANTLSKEAGRNQAVAEYHEGLLDALRQSADGIAAFKTARSDFDHLSRAQASMQSIYDANRARLQNGIVSYEQLYASQANLIRQSESLAEARAKLASSHIGLIQALGGGYGQNIGQNSGQKITGETVSLNSTAKSTASPSK
jgi:NodT family efflux transporter outer membrane factor (OMF) lipoprotein